MQDSTLKLVERALNPPLTDRTLVERRNLLIAACVSVLVHVQPTTLASDLKVFDYPVAIQLFQGSMAVAVAYLLVMFVVYFVADLHQWYLSRVVVLDLTSLPAEIEDFTAKHAGAYNAFAQYCFEKKLWADHPPVMEVQALRESMGRTAGDLRERLSAVHEEYRKRNRLTTVWQLFRTGVLDVAVPVILGAIALWQARAAVRPFIDSVVRSLA